MNNVSIIRKSLQEALGTLEIIHECQDKPQKIYKAFQDYCYRSLSDNIKQAHTDCLLELEQLLSSMQVDSLKDNHKPKV